MDRVECSCRHVGLELSVRAWHLERCVLSAAPRAREDVRRARVLRAALRHGRGELDVLRPAARRGHAALGRTHAARLRVLRQALPEVHAPEDVQGRASKAHFAGWCRRCDLRSREDPFLDASLRPNQADLDDVPPRHRTAGERAASSAPCSHSSRQASRTPSRAEYPRHTLCRPFTAIRSRWSCGIAAGATPSARRSTF